MLPILDYAPKLNQNISVDNLLRNQITNSIIVLEYMPLELFNFLDKQRSLSDFAIINSSDVIKVQSRQIFKQFKQNPVKYTAQLIHDMSVLLHAINVEAQWVHRDIKSENIFIQIIDASNMSDIKIRFVLGDCELSTPIDKMLARTNRNKKILVGTPFMGSPELTQIELLHKHNVNLTSSEDLMNSGVNMSSLATSIDAYSTVCLIVGVVCFFVFFFQFLSCLIHQVRCICMIFFACIYRC